MLTSYGTIFTHQVAFILPPTMLKGLLNRARRMLITIHFNRRQDNNSINVLTITFSSTTMERFRPNPRTITISNRGTKDKVRPHHNRQRSLRQHVRGISLISPLNKSHFSNPYRNFTFSGHPGLLTITLNRLLQVIRRKIIRVKQRRRNHYGSQPNRAPPPNLITSHFKGVMLGTVFGRDRGRWVVNAQRGSEGANGGLLRTHHQGLLQRGLREQVLQPRGRVPGRTQGTNPRDRSRPSSKRGHQGTANVSKSISPSHNHPASSTRQPDG